MMMIIMFKQNQTKTNNTKMVTTLFNQMWIDEQINKKFLYQNSSSFSVYDDDRLWWINIYSEAE